MLKLKKTNGFTLIELLVVLALIGILAGAGILINYPTQMRKARDSQRKADMEKVRSALEMYRADSGCYPESLSFSGTATLTYNGRTYLDPIPGDTTRYSYTSSGLVLCRNSFLLNANLETGGAYQVTPEGTNVIIASPTPTPTFTPTPTPTRTPTPTPTPACGALGSVCGAPSQCCSGICSGTPNGYCISPTPTPACKLIDETCKFNTDCCCYLNGTGGTCTGGRCRCQTEL